MSKQWQDWNVYPGRRWYGYKFDYPPWLEDFVGTEYPYRRGDVYKRYRDGDRELRPTANYFNGAASFLSKGIRKAQKVKQLRSELKERSDVRFRNKVRWAQRVAGLKIGDFLLRKANKRRGAAYLKLRKFAKKNLPAYKDKITLRGMNERLNRYQDWKEAQPPMTPAQKAAWIAEQPPYVMPDPEYLRQYNADHREFQRTRFEYNADKYLKAKKARADFRDLIYNKWLSRQYGRQANEPDVPDPGPLPDFSHRRNKRSRHALDHDYWANQPRGDDWVVERGSKRQRTQGQGSSTDRWVTQEDDDDGQVGNDTMVDMQNDHGFHVEHHETAPTWDDSYIHN